MRYCLLICLVVTSLFAPGASAQTQLGQPTLDEQKTQIWCATMKFVYGDTGRPNLQGTLRCGGPLKEFEKSIKADSQKVYSMLYRPLETKGAMYNGLGSDKSRLQKLTIEIINKLKASPARRKDPARMQGVQALEAQLKGYVENGTPPTDIATAIPDDQTDVIDTAATDDVVASPAEIGLGSQQVSRAPKAVGAESVMSKFFAPLSLILSLLSIFLYVTLRRSISALGSRADRHSNDLESVKATNNGLPLRPSVVGSTLTPELQREIEKLVQQRVAEELNKRQGNGQPQDQSLPCNLSSPSPTLPVTAPAPPSSPQPVVPSAPIGMLETTSQPSHEATPPLAVSPHDEFESLIPPVQRPGTNRTESAS